MAKIKFSDVTVSFPVYDRCGMSLRQRLINIGTGGRISQEAKHVVTITSLNRVSFEINDGDAVGLVGHNGAGKTTLIRTMAGIFRPISGQVAVQGKVSTIIELGAGMDSELSGYENIFRMGMLLGATRKELENQLGEIENFAELGRFLEVPVRTYSSGMLVRLMFAVATSIKPEILLVDEMFGVGDANFQVKAQRRMAELVESAKILVFASHDPKLIQRYCNRVLVLEHGAVSEQK